MKIVLLLVAGLLWLGSIVVAQAIDPVWTKTHSGNSSGEESAFGMAFDSVGNLFVAGYESTAVNGLDFLLLKYSADGNSIRTNRYRSSGANNDVAFAVCVDPQGNVIAAGANITSDKFVTIKYSNAGTPVWTNLLQTPDSGYPRGVATDTNGNVFVCGAAGPWCTVKYSANGAPLWTNFYGVNLGGHPTRFDLDGDGNIIIVGSDGVFPQTDIVTLKYSKSGVPVWTNHYNGPANHRDYGYDIDVDKNGDAVVVGMAAIEIGNDQMVTIRYSSTGVPLWTNLHAGSIGGNFNPATALKIIPSGEILVTGSSHTSSPDIKHITTLKCSSNGNPMWTNCFESATGSTPAIEGLATDNCGNVFITGALGYGQILTLALSPEGVLMWTNVVAGQSYAVAVDASDEVYVAGSNGADGTGDLFLMKLPAAPALLNIRRAGTSTIVSWNKSSLKLQSAPEIGGVFTNVPNAINPFTNAAVGTRFFRLAQ